MSMLKSRRGFFAMCGGLLASFGLRRKAAVYGGSALVPADPVELSPVGSDPTTGNFLYDSEEQLSSVTESSVPGGATVYTYDSQHRLLSVYEAGEPSEATVYTYG